MWALVFAYRAQKDAVKLARAGLKPQAQKLLDLLRVNPWKTPPTLEKLHGDLAGLYSRRINRQHRLVYEVLEAERTVKVLAMWTHYE